MHSSGEERIIHWRAAHSSLRSVLRTRLLFRANREHDSCPSRTRFVLRTRIHLSGSEYLALLGV